MTIIASVLGLLVLFEFITGLYLDNEGYSLAKGLPYPVPARVAPVCNLEQVEAEHSISIIPGEDNFQVIQVLLDEGVVRLVLISSQFSMCFPCILIPHAYEAKIIFPDHFPLFVLPTLTVKKKTLFLGWRH